MAYTFADGGRASGTEAAHPAGSLIAWAGAAVSLVLLAGLGLWGWQLLVQDVTGVPVVRALQGPMRIAPEDPGGEIAQYQDLSVTRVASIGADEAPAERVVLAPAPLALADEDLAAAALIPDTAEGGDEIVTPAAAAKSAIELAIAEALADTAVGSDIAPRAASATETEALPVPAAFRPAARPDDLARTAAIAVPGPEAPAGTVPEGTRLVQLGAFASAAEAEAAWATLQGRLGDLLDGRDKLVQEAEAAGSTFYRLRAAGFDDLAEARRFCAALVAEQADCIPVIQR